MTTLKDIIRDALTDFDTADNFIPLDEKVEYLHKAIINYLNQ